MKKCQQCSAPLSGDEIGLSLRLLGRDGDRLLCKSCLAKAFRVDTDVMDRKIQQYKEQGCPLFT